MCQPAECKCSSGVFRSLALRDEHQGTAFLLAAFWSSAGIHSEWNSG
jgi:hypothetical protein